MQLLRVSSPPLSSTSWTSQTSSKRPAHFTLRMPALIPSRRPATPLMRLPVDFIVQACLLLQLDMPHSAISECQISLPPAVSRPVQEEINKAGRRSTSVGRQLAEGWPESVAVSQERPTRHRARPPPKLANDRHDAVRADGAKNFTKREVSTIEANGLK